MAPRVKLGSDWLRIQTSILQALKRKKPSIAGILRTEFKLNDTLS